MSFAVKHKAVQAWFQGLVFCVSHSNSTPSRSHSVCILGTGICWTCGNFGMKGKPHDVTVQGTNLAPTKKSDFAQYFLRPVSLAPSSCIYYGPLSYDVCDVVT